MDGKGAFLCNSFNISRISKSWALACLCILGFIYEVKPCDIRAENAVIVQGTDAYYAIIKNVPMSADPNVQRAEGGGQVRVEAEILSAEWLDNGASIAVVGNSFPITPFLYGESYSVRVAKLKLK